MARRQFFRKVKAGWLVGAELLARATAYLRQGRALGPGVWATLSILREGGLDALAAVLLVEPSTSYTDWIDATEPQDHTFLLDRLATTPDLPRISVLMPVYRTPPHLLIAAIESVRRQSYANWDLCIADDASADPVVTRILDDYARRDPRIRVVVRERNGHISRATQSAFELVRTEWVTLLDHDDELAPDALGELAVAIADHPEAQLIYSDEDKIDAAGRRLSPYFKPDYSPTLLLGQNYFNHLTAHRADNIRRAGGWRPEFDGSQDHDLVLRIVKDIPTDTIVHIPKILYHWRIVAGSTSGDRGAKSYALDAGLRAVSSFLASTGDSATASLVDGLPFYRITPSVPTPPPLVSLIVPTRNGVDLLRRCVESIVMRSTYPDFEILIVDNQSDDPAALAFLARLEKRPDTRVLRYDAPFNYAAINNLAAAEAKGDVLVLLNNDVEVISPGWLEELVGWAVRPEIGCVGAKLHYPDGRLQHAGVIVGMLGVAAHRYKFADGDANGYFGLLKVAHEVSAVTGACLAVRRQTYLEVGGLDADKLRVAFNDIDFCLKVRALGLRNLWTPEARLYHHESATRGSDEVGEKRQRFVAEVETMQQRWIGVPEPYYSPNLTLAGDNYAIAGGPSPQLRLAIGAIVRNEAPYLLEWIAFHRAVGVDRFYICDDGSEDGTSVLLEQLAGAGLITHFPVQHRAEVGRQLAAYREILRRHHREFDWIGMIDADEFAVPLDGARSIRPVFHQLARNPAIGAIAANWAIYGSSGQRQAGPGLVIERFARRAPEDFVTNHHVKSWFRSTAFTDEFLNPHVAHLREGFHTVQTDGTPLIHHPALGPGLSETIKLRGFRLNHYAVKSYAEFEKKLQRGQADGALPRTTAYFDYHDRNEVLDPVEPWLIRATQREMSNIQEKLRRAGGRTRSGPLLEIEVPA